MEPEISNELVLELEEEAIFKQFKWKLRKFHLGPIYDDFFLIRFLRAKKFKLELAVTFFQNYLTWRVEQDIDNALLFKFPEINKIRKIYEHGYHKTDKTGRPIYFERYEKINFKMMYELTTEERVVRYFIREYERFVIEKLPAASEAAGRRIEDGLCVLDLRGISVGFINGQLINLLKKVSFISTNYYPELLNQMLVVNAPAFVRAMWTILTAFIDETTKSRITVIGEDFHDKIREFIHEDDIPEYLGGNCRCPQGCLNSDIGPWNPEAKPRDECGSQLEEDEYLERESIGRKVEFIIPEQRKRDCYCTLFQLIYKFIILIKSHLYMFATPKKQRPRPKKKIAKPDPPPQKEISPQDQEIADQMRNEMQQAEKLLGSLSFNQDSLVPLKDLKTKLKKFPISPHEFLDQNNELQQRVSKISKDIENLSTTQSTKHNAMETQFLQESMTSDANSLLYTQETLEEKAQEDSKEETKSLANSKQKPRQKAEEKKKEETKRRPGSKQKPKQKAEEAKTEETKSLSGSQQTPEDQAEDQIKEVSESLPEPVRKLKEKVNETKSTIKNMSSYFQEKQKPMIEKAGIDMNRKLKPQKQAYKQQIETDKKALASKKGIDHKTIEKKIEGAKKTFTAKMKKLVQGIGAEGTEESVRAWLVRVTNDYINEQVRVAKQKSMKQFKEVHIKYNKAILHLRGEIEHVKNAIQQSRIAQKNQEQGKAEDIKSSISKGIAHLSNYGILSLKNLQEISNNVRDTILGAKKDVSKLVASDKIENVLKSVNDSRKEVQEGLVSLQESNEAEITAIEAEFEEAKSLNNEAISKMVKGSTREFTKICEQLQGKQEELKESVRLLSDDLRDLVQQIGTEVDLDILALIKDELT